MTEPIPFVLRSAPPVLVNHDLVFDLELLLARARAGEITGFAWTAIDAIGAHETGWRSMYWEQNAALLGATELLHSEFKRAIDD